MKEKAGQGSYVLCDFWRCSRRFATVSDSSVVRAQAETVDICPDHPMELPRPNKQPRKKKAA